MSLKSLPTAEELNRSWRESPRWRGVQRGYAAADVVRLRGTVPVEHSIARLTAEKLWRYLKEKPFVNALGALTGNQAMQQVKAGLDAIYLSGWQVAGDANLSGQMYPDQSLYPADSVPAVVRRINNTLRRADEICHAEGDDSIDWLKPIVADAEAGFGGGLNAFELMKQMIEAGAAGVHFEDQLSSAKKCGHMGGKVLVSTQDAVAKLVAARLAADVCNVPTVLVARTDAEGRPADLGCRCARPRLHRCCQGPHRGRLLLRQGGTAAGHRPWSCLRPVCGPGVVRDRETGSGRGA
jgi:isocitrate lyase